MFDEKYVLTQAANITIEQATEAKRVADDLYTSEDEALSGTRVESDMAQSALRNWQGRIKTDPAELAPALLKLASGSHTASLVAAGQLVTAHQSEQTIVRRIITAKEQAVATARKAFELGELNLMRADLRRQEAAAILIAVKHLAVVKMVCEADPTIELPVSQALTAAIDNVLELQQHIARKEKQ